MGSVVGSVGSEAGSAGGSDGSVSEARRKRALPDRAGSKLLKEESRFQNRSGSGAIQEARFRLASAALPSEASF